MFVPNLNPDHTRPRLGRVGGDGRRGDVSASAGAESTELVQPLHTATASASGTAP
jgi:hypothetical protein